MERETIASAVGGAVEGAVEGTTSALRVARLAGLLAYDELLLLAVRRLRGPWRTRAALFLTAAGDGRTWTAVAIAFLASGRRDRKSVCRERV